MTLTTIGPIEIFREGTFTPQEGKPLTFGAADLKAIADGYNANAEAPIVVGHPQTDTPAFGWVDKLTFKDGKLLATIKDVVAEFADMVKNGHYRKVSASLFAPKNAANPVPGTWYLKHVGFLGGAAPAVTGLKSVQLAAPSDTVEFAFDFSDDASFNEVSSFAHMQDELRQLRREKLDLRVDKLVEKGHLLPAHKDEVVEFCASDSESVTVSFASGNASTGSEWLLAFLERQPPVVNFGKMDLGVEHFAQSPAYVAPEGYTADPTRIEIYNKATVIQREKGISFAAALDLVRER